MTLLEKMRDKDPKVSPVVNAIKHLHTVDEIRRFMAEVETHVQTNPTHPFTADETIINVRGSLPILLGHYDQKTQDLWKEAYPVMMERS